MWTFPNCITVLASLCVQYVSCELMMFRKCCTQYQNLVKITDTNEITIFQCESLDSIELKYGITTSPLIISKDIEVIYGMPEHCEKDIDELEIERLIELTPEKYICYDKMVLEMQNDEMIKGSVPKTVILKCRFNEVNNTRNAIINIDHIRKCCPGKHVYDVLTKECSRCQDDIEEEWLTREIKAVGPRIYDVDTGINCKTEQYAMDLLSETFSLDVYGSSLLAVRHTMTKEQEIGEGEWCMDRRKDNSGLVARVCTNDARSFGAYPIRKCCPEGKHFKVRKCNSMRSMCVPNTDRELIFNVSMYLDPLKQKDKNFPDLLGVRTLLNCPKGKFAANKTRLEDRNSLNLDGTLQILNRKENNYCLEEFDRRHCHDDNPIDLTAVLCYPEPPVSSRNFYLSFTLNTTSAVFLALTILVYILLPDLHNLHGRIVICHAGSLLLAYSFLARTQHHRIDDRLCAVFGYAIYFWFVSAFAWNNVTCWDIWRTFGGIRSVHQTHKSREDQRRFLWYSLYAWSFASVLTLTTFLLDKYPLAAVLDSDIGIDICWFNPVRSGGWAHTIFFVIPMGLLTCINFVLWVLTARHCARVKSQLERLQNSFDGNAFKRFNNNNETYILTTKLFVVMGAGWLAETLSILIKKPNWLWKIVARFNELQGVFIFIILILKPTIFYMIKKRLSRGRN